MSSFIMSMLEEGVEVAVPTDLNAVVSMLDREIPHFSCFGYGFTVTSGKGTLGKRWELMIKSVNHAKGDPKLFPLGRVELEKLDDHFVKFRIPPRIDKESPSAGESQGADEHDPDGRIFGSFVSQTLNMLQRYNLIELPGVLPEA
ncbi:MAG: hypothetical protein BZY75_00205 [SAR202 cluster bacterium Io17-Chloro-G7]|nr:MAG: hypothetical protein BZY75_00205 [SAR202 cluster bacterium Io17-Chloro-G7]